MVLKFEPWGAVPVFEWDEYNEAKMWAHGVHMFEVEQCFDRENERFVIPHPKAKSQPEKYSDRYMVRGVTNGGRKLIITVRHISGDIIRPITARDL